MGMNVQIEAYTKTGFKVILSQSVRDDQRAKDVMNMPDRLGLLHEKPEKPDETEYAKISHVALTSKDDGTLHMAFYHQNEKMLSRYTHHYFDDETDKTQFERWSGLVVADMPIMPDNSHPQRDKATFKKYAVRLESPKALIRRTTYTKTDEGWEANHSVERYIGSTSASSEQNKTDDALSGLTLDTWKAGEAQAASVQAYLVEEGITEEEALQAIPPKNWNAFPTAEAAMKVISLHINKPKPDTQESHFKKVPGAGAEGFANYHRRQAEDADSKLADDDKESDDATLELDDIPF
jgi:hypothetical protein